MAKTAAECTMIIMKRLYDIFTSVISLLYQIHNKMLIRAKVITENVSAHQCHSACFGHKIRLGYVQ